MATFRSAAVKGHCCGTCAHSRFTLTPKGNIVDRSGTCLKTIELPTVPTCVEVRMHRTAIWPDMGVGCPTWEST
jgi:hypothetical protein